MGEEAIYLCLTTFPLQLPCLHGFQFMVIRTPLCDSGGSGWDKHSLVWVPSMECVVQRNPGVWAYLCHPSLTLPFLAHADMKTHFSISQIRR